MWLSRTRLAQYMGMDPRNTYRFTKEPSFPRPSLALGERSPRWNRREVDLYFLAGQEDWSGLRGLVESALGEPAAREVCQALQGGDVSRRFVGVLEMHPDARPFLARLFEVRGIAELQGMALRRVR